MLDLILLLAEGAQVADGLPAWAKYILGPLGALVLMGVYAYRNEKITKPAYKKIIDDKDVLIDVGRKKLHEFRDKCDADKEEMREKFEVKERVLERDVQDWRDRHTKEKSVRAWYQAQAEQMADEAGEKLKPPPDIDKTHYGGDD